MGLGGRDVVRCDYAFIQLPCCRLVDLNYRRDLVEIRQTLHAAIDHWVVPCEYKAAFEADFIVDSC